jgi:hypothetical protein
MTEKEQLKMIMNEIMIIKIKVKKILDKLESAESDDDKFYGKTI